MRSNPNPNPNPGPHLIYLYILMSAWTWHIFLSASFNCAKKTLSPKLNTRRIQIQTIILRRDDDDDTGRRRKRPKSQLCCSKLVRILLLFFLFWSTKEHWTGALSRVYIWWWISGVYGQTVYKWGEKKQMKSFYIYIYSLCESQHIFKTSAYSRVDLNAQYFLFFVCWLNSLNLPAIFALSLNTKHVQSYMYIYIAPRLLLHSNKIMRKLTIQLAEFMHNTFWSRRPYLQGVSGTKCFCDTFHIDWHL